MKSTLKALGISFGLIALIILSVTWVDAFADEGDYWTKQAEKEKPIPVSHCPETGIYGKLSDCLSCHTVPSFRLKETSPDEGYSFPGGCQFIWKDGKPVKLRYYLTSPTASYVYDAIKYADKHNIKHLIVDIESFGGSLFECWESKALLSKWAKEKGNFLETRVHGKAMSAGFLLFLTGEKRIVGTNAELMWHEAQIGEWPEMTSPSATDEKAKVYRHLQDNANSYIASRTNMTKEEVDELVRLKEFWITGPRAVELGIATGLLD